MLAPQDTSNASSTVLASLQRRHFTFTYVALTQTGLQNWRGSYLLSPKVDGAASVGCYCYDRFLKLCKLANRHGTGPLGQFFH